jgi:protein-S-isoprenylcysteine O-methyltransferase Ste14
MSDSAAGAPRVIAPPPLLYAAGMVFGVLLQWLIPVQPLPPRLARLLGGLLLVASVGVAKWGKTALARAGTPSSPNRPTRAVVTEGPFQFSRNPLYLATTGVYLGLSLLLDALWPILLLVPVLLALHWGVVLREERYLEEKFGEVYRSYQARVRRWF